MRVINQIKTTVQRLFANKRARLALFAIGFAVIGVIVLQLTRASDNDVPTPPIQSQFVSNELLIKIKPAVKGKVKETGPIDTGLASLDTIHQKHGVKHIEKIAKAGKNSKTDAAAFAWYKVTVPGPADKVQGELDKSKKITKAPKTGKPGQEVNRLQTLITDYQNDPNVEDVSLNGIVQTTVVPNDPYYPTSGTVPAGDLWGMHKINAETAWDQTTGSASVLVADIDTGQDRNHEDLAANMWVNPKEIPGNGIDDDGNGYVDDVNGWNFYNNNNDTMDHQGHGTHTAGTIAAVGNNGKGVVGVNWTAKIMSVDIFGTSSGAPFSSCVAGLVYAADNGARVSNNSWGAIQKIPVIDDAVAYEHDKGMTVVASAGNNFTDAGAFGFTPATAHYAIAVSATDSNDLKANFSNYGDRIDVGAPGVSVLSTTPNNTYQVFSGTSMAAPHVTGLVALLLAKNPTLTNEEIRQIIRQSADDIGAAGKDSNFGYGRINAGKALSLANIHPLAPVITSPLSYKEVSGTNVAVTGSVPGSNFASYTLNGAFSLPITSTTQPTTNMTLATIDTTKFTEDYPINVTLTATDTAGKTYDFKSYYVRVNNFETNISAPSNKLLSMGSHAIFGTAKTNTLGFSSYKLDWGLGAAPTTWSTSGVALTNSSQPVVNGQLGTWDTSTLKDGQVYTLRLTVTASGGLTNQSMMQYTADKDMVAGWPKNIPNSPLCNVSSLCRPTTTFADLDGDGTKEIIVTSPDNKLYVFRKDGSNFPGFPVTVPDPGYFVNPPTVADLDGDGHKEIIATAAAVNTADCNNNNLTGAVCGERIYIIRSDGSLYPGWPAPVLTGTSIFESNASPVVVDLDGDSKPELFVIESYGFKDRTMHAFHLDGSELSGWPKQAPYPESGYYRTQISPVIAVDLDHDGHPELAFSAGYKMYLLDNTGSLLPGWPQSSTDGNFATAPATGNIDGNSTDELFAEDYHNGVAVNSLYAWQKDGSSLSGWPKSTGTAIGGYGENLGPSVADLDGDGKDEVVLSDLWQTEIFNQNGLATTNPGLVSYTRPALGDVDGDGHIDMATAGKGIAVLKDDASTYWTRDAGYFENDNAPPVMADIDNNGREELAIGADYGNVFLWEVPQPCTNGAKYDWPMSGHDPQRSGRLIRNTQAAPACSGTTSGGGGSGGGGSGGGSLSVNLTQPQDGATVPMGKSIVLKANTNSVNKVSKVEFYVDNVKKCSDTSAPYICSWRVPSVSGTKHSLKTIVYDALANTQTSAPINVTEGADTTFPTVDILTPADQSTVLHNATVPISADAQDEVGVSKVEFYVNGSRKCSDTSYPFSCNWKTASTIGTTYSIFTKAYDYAGNVTSSIVTTVTSN